MVNKALVYGISGFIMGGLVVSIAATTFDKNDSALQNRSDTSGTSMTMEQMTTSLTGLEGDAYDMEFVSSMIEHHQAAVDMANLSASRAKHPEIKKLSQDIITAQQKEIGAMRQWQIDWGYGSTRMDHSMEGM